MTSSSNFPSDDRHARIVAIVAECLGRYAGGEGVDIEEMEKAYPDVMPDLSIAITKAIKQAEIAKFEVTQIYEHRDGEETVGYDPVIKQTDLDVTLDQLSATRRDHSVVRFDQGTADSQITGRHHFGPNHRLLKLHAEGGLGRIWLAHDQELNRDFALKEMRDADGDTIVNLKV